MNRLEAIIELIERGEPITPAHVNQVVALQALDQAVADDRFVAEFFTQQAAADQALEAQQ